MFNLNQSLIRLPICKLILLTIEPSLYVIEHLFILWADQFKVIKYFLCGGYICSSEMGAQMIDKRVADSVVKVTI